MVRRCIVGQLGDIPGVAVYAYDDNEGISGDLANYWDPPHLYNEIALREILVRMSRGDGRLTTTNVDGYVQRLRFLVTHYHLKDPRLPAYRSGAPG